jgi:hypothetical protein
MIVERKDFKIKLGRLLGQGIHIQVTFFADDDFLVYAPDIQKWLRENTTGRRTHTRVSQMNIEFDDETDALMFELRFRS